MGRFCKGLLVLAFQGVLILCGFSDLFGAGWTGGYAGGCTSFCLHDGTGAIFGTNLDNDWPEGQLFINKRGIRKTVPDLTGQGAPAVWTSRYASLTFNYTGYQLAWAGMNEKGLIFSTMGLPETAPPAVDQRPSLDSGLWFQYMLDTCASIEELVAAASRVRMGFTVDHYLVADRTGNRAVIEFINRQMVVHTGSNLPVAALSNTIYEIALSNWNRERNGLPWASGDGSVVHFVTAAGRIAGFQPEGTEADVDYAFDTLASLSDISTQWSIVFDARCLRAYFRTSGNPARRYVDLSMFDGDCRTPVRMLDIQEDLAGDVSSGFIDFSYDLVLQHAVRWYAHFGITPTVPIEDVLNIAVNWPCCGTYAERIFHGPHLTSLAPWSNWITVYNGGAAAANFELVIHDSSGTRAFTQDFTVPGLSQLVLAPGGGRHAVTADEAIPVVEGTFIIRTSSRMLSPKLSFRYGDSPSVSEFILQDTMAHGYLLANPAGNHFDWTGIALMNPYDDPLQVELEAYRRGVLAGRTTAVIGPRGKYVRLSESIWPGLTCTDFDQVQVVSAGGSLPPPLSITGNGVQDRHVFFSGVTAPAGEGPFRYYGPHLTSLAPWINRVAVYNSGGTPADFTLVLCNSEGSVQHEQTYPAPAHGAATFVLTSLAGYRPAAGEIVLPPLEGTCRIETGSPLLHPLLSFRYGESPSLTEFFLSASRAEEYILPNPELDWFDWAGTAVMNPGPRPMPLVLEALRDGRRVGMAHGSIPPGEKYVRLSDSIWPRLDRQDFTHLRIISPGGPLPPPVSITGNGAQDRHLFFTGTAMEAVPPELDLSRMLSSSEAEADLDQFQNQLEQRAAYLRRNEPDFRGVIQAIKARSESGLTIEELGLEMDKVIGMFIDSHATMGGYYIPAGYLPFQIRAAGGRYVALLNDHSAFLDPEHPFITTLDGRSIDSWCDAFSVIIPEGSPQFVQTICLMWLPAIQFARLVSGEPQTADLSAGLESAGGESKVLRRMPLSPVLLADSGRWPFTPSHIRGDNIGYLRINNMMEAGRTELRTWMPRMLATRALIIDLRQNHGGMRAVAEELHAWLVTGATPPRVKSAGKYRLYSGFTPDHLFTRHMYPLEWPGWTAAQRQAIQQFIQGFQPEWLVPEDEFSPWHYWLPGKDLYPATGNYRQPVTVLMDGGCMSACDICLSALKGMPGVRLIGQPSGGCSGAYHESTLQNSGLTVRLSSMAAFQKDGRLYDSRGIEPDILVEPEYGYFLTGGRDLALEMALFQIEHGFTEPKRQVE